MSITAAVFMLNRTPSVLATLCFGSLLGLVVGHSAAEANPPDQAPEALQAAIATVEAAANAQDLQQLMALYSPDFESADGFTRDQYAATLSEFWSQYVTLSYDVVLTEWEPANNGFIAETTTTVQGMREVAGRSLNLTATVTSRQHYEDGLIVSQQIVDETSRLTSGMAPPSVAIRLPAKVTPGQRFAFDAIVQEPLGDRLLLGRALDEGVTAEDFLAPRPIDLTELATGGLFKIGTAPDHPDQRWISSVLIREDGIVIDTRRLRIEE